MDLIMQRVAAMFPESDRQLVIPTQHNQILSIGDYSGVEVDCYSPEFNRKVQLLVHFENSRLEKADVFRNMLAHTFKYRQSQLYDFIDTILEDSLEPRLMKAAAATGANQELIDFVRVETLRLKQLIEEHYSTTPPEMLRNKLLRNYFETLRPSAGDRLVDLAQIFLREVKREVKRNFELSHFYETQQVIEEVRSLGGGIIIPHPEQFWPILLADYDVDGYEVWNPQSREYTDFLINVVVRQNRRRAKTHRPLLIMMGDDCHIGEKVKDPALQDKAKAAREIGFQPAWDDVQVRKSLVLAGIDRRKMLEEYEDRLKTG